MLCLASQQPLSQVVRTFMTRLVRLRYDTVFHLASSIDHKALGLFCCMYAIPTDSVWRSMSMQVRHQHNQNVRGICYM